MTFQFLFALLLIKFGSIEDVEEMEYSFECLQNPIYPVIISSIKILWGEFEWSTSFSISFLRYDNDIALGNYFKRIYYNEGYKL